MAQKRARASTSQAASTSAPKHRLPELHSRLARYSSSLTHKTPIPERGFDTKESQIVGVIRKRGWKNFCKQPEPAVLPLVHEFYANAHKDCDDTVIVRDKPVKFDSFSINAFYQIPNIINDGYSEYKNNHLNYQEIAAFLCIPGTTWTLSHTSNEPLSLSKAALKDRYVKAWHAFICAKFFPSSHLSDITVQKAILLFAILSGKSVNVGRVIHESILLYMRTTTRALYFLSLITELCKQVGVQ